MSLSGPFPRVPGGLEVPARRSLDVQLDILGFRWLLLWPAGKAAV